VYNAATVLAWVGSAALVAWVFHLVRRDQLHVGYGVIIVIVLLAGAGVLSSSAALRITNRLRPLVEGAPGLFVLALTFMFLMIVYILAQVTALSNRLTRVVQELAIRQAQVPVPPGASTVEPKVVATGESAARGQSS
jgi:hypothetical protein